LCSQSSSQFAGEDYNVKRWLAYVGEQLIGKKGLGPSSRRIKRREIRKGEEVKEEERNKRSKM
jgi:hypothetical protein